MSYIRYDPDRRESHPRTLTIRMSTSPATTSDSPALPAGGAAAPTPAFSPLYQQIKGLILQSLQHGEWKPGEAIPSEMDLAGRFRVSQGTVRKAIDELAAENLVMRRQGKGTFVATHAERHVQYRFLKLQPDEGDADTEGPAQRRIIECRRMRASADIARALALRTGDAVVMARRILSFSEVPTILEDIWLPGQAFRGLTAERLAGYPGPTYAMFELEFGVRMVRADEKIRAVLPDAEQAALLGIDAGTPLLSVERIACTYNDVPMELRRGLYRTDTHHYHNALQ
ncbi:transcriptional regulator, GntR family [Paracidovorax konjaci]|uniref:Transcriptional regulator, GntR family n=2 Tax=Paracidovorax konjaci TaxID=32040 RepID=A0A1I1THS5_9BURK|nr:transcriptional regulator, GntR family [Paracidovorax konjaci]